MGDFQGEMTERGKIEELEKILEELGKIIAYFYPENSSSEEKPKKKSKSKDKDKKENDQSEKNEDNNEDHLKLRKEYPEGYIQIAEAYRRFYSNCLVKLKKGKTIEQNCEPTYKTFYELYIDPNEKDIDSISDKRLDDNIKSLIKKFKAKIHEYYEKVMDKGEMPSHVLRFCECKSEKKEKKICLCVKESPKVIIYKEKNDPEIIVDCSSGEKVLAKIKEAGTAFYLHSLGFVIPLQFAAIVSVVYLITFFVAMFVHKISVTNINGIYETLLVASIFVIVSFIGIFKDYRRLIDEAGKVALSNITKLTLIPFISFKERRFVNTLNKNIVAYKQNDGYITLSIFDVQCPICNNAGHHNSLNAKNENKDMIFECKGERLHRFSFDKVLKIGKLIKWFIDLF